MHNPLNIPAGLRCARLFEVANSCMLCSVPLNPLNKFCTLETVYRQGSLEQS
jgi:hypothetical protein